MLNSAYLVSFTGSSVIATCCEFIIFYIDTWLDVDLLITREKSVAIVIIFRIRVISLRKLNLTKTSSRK